MNAKAVLIPNSKHPISIEPHRGRVTVVVSGQVIADTTAALSLTEASYPPVLYIPREAVDMTMLQRSSHTTHCPYKGNCSYYSIPAGGPRAVNAVWTYEAPHEAVSAIKEHMAFYPDRVDAVKVER